MEIWKDITGYEGIYQVSSLGNIKRLYKNKCKIIKSTFNDRGYLTVVLWNTDTTNVPRRKRYRIHRLVADIFIPKIDGKNFINHKDGNKCNNNVDNLEWCTRRENMLHSYKTGLRIPNTGKKYKRRCSHGKRNSF